MARLAGEGDPFHAMEMGAASLPVLSRAAGAPGSLADPTIAARRAILLERFLLGSLCSFCAGSARLLSAMDPLLRDAARQPDFQRAAGLRGRADLREGAARARSCIHGQAQGLPCPDDGHRVPGHVACGLYGRQRSLEAAAPPGSLRGWRRGHRHGVDRCRVGHAGMGPVAGRQSAQHGLSACHHYLGLHASRSMPARSCGSTATSC